jgi:hypothetical protein
VELSGENGLLTALVRQVLQTGLEVELTDHLGYQPHVPEGGDAVGARRQRDRRALRTDAGVARVDDVSGRSWAYVSSARWRRVTRVCVSRRGGGPGAGHAPQPTTTPNDCYELVQVNPDCGTEPFDVGGLNVQLTVNTSSPASKIPLALASWNTVMVADVNATSVMVSVH